MHSAKGSTQNDKFIPETRDAHELIQDDNPIEKAVPTLIIGTATSAEENGALQGMIDRADDSLKEYMGDPNFTDEIPEAVEEQISKLNSDYFAVFSTRLTCGPACGIPPLKLLLRDGFKPCMAKAGPYQPRKHAFLPTTCKALTD